MRSDWYANEAMGIAGTVASPRVRVLAMATAPFTVKPSQLRSHACNDGGKRPTGSGESTG